MEWGTAQIVFLAAFPWFPIVSQCVGVATPVVFDPFSGRTRSFMSVRFPTISAPSVTRPQDHRGRDLVPLPHYQRKLQCTLTFWLEFLDHFRNCVTVDHSARHLCACDLIRPQIYLFSLSSLL